MEIEKEGEPNDVKIQERDKGQKRNKVLNKVSFMFKLYVNLIGLEENFGLHFFIYGFQVILNFQKGIESNRIIFIVIVVNIMENIEIEVL